MREAPTLEGDALEAVLHRGSHVQIIASAGSGKTEVVAQRVAALLAEGVPPGGIVAFTFTERAAAELKDRIEARVVARLGTEALDRLTGLFVGTIHSYCFGLLRQHVPQYETYDVLDENQLTAFVSREARRLNIRQFDSRNRLFASLQKFLHNVEVVDNELLDFSSLPEDFRTVLQDYNDTLNRYRLLTFGQQVRIAVEALQQRQVASAVHQTLRYLIVDEYQDINPAQEKLISLLTGPTTELCVVGDDDQSIYQWRGADVDNIVTFASRYMNVKTFKLANNRRSRPEIIEAANSFAQSISNRLEKTMNPTRPTEGSVQRVVVWKEVDETTEADRITRIVLRMNEAGVSFGDIGILVRSRASYRRLLEQFELHGVPVQPGGRTGLFDQPEAVVLAKTYCWLSSIEWRESFQGGEEIELLPLLEEYEKVFRLQGESHKNRIKEKLEKWQTHAIDDTKSADLVGDFYDLLEALEVRHWDFDNRSCLNSVGTLARFSTLLKDYESVRRRARQDADAHGEQVGGEWGGEWYHRNLAIHIVHYAQGAYEGFDGEPDLMLDAVDITTVHRAKGLEWPVVFVPCLTANRFPASRTGRPQDWLVPRELFNAARYEGSDADERRLFYVAATRARDFLSISRHDRVTKQSVGSSPYWEELEGYHIDPNRIVPPSIEAQSSGDEEILAITFSELATYLDCGLAYRLRSLLGFRPRLVPELGYGKALHHILRQVAEHTQKEGSVPNSSDLDQMLDAHFFLPTASKSVHRDMKQAARRIIDNYIENHEPDLQRIWETERPLELHLDGVKVSGRADVIMDKEGDASTELAILDYKTSTGEDSTLHELQLRVYANAGQREGLEIRAAYLHDLRGRRDEVAIDPSHLTSAEEIIKKAATKIRNREFDPSPGAKCLKCDVRAICKARDR